MPGLGAVAYQAGAVREQLADFGRRERFRQASDVGSDRVIQPEPAGLHQGHQGRGGEAFRVRRRAKAMTRGEGGGLRKVSHAERPLEDHASHMRDRDGATRFAAQAHLKAEPVLDVVQGGREPGVHHG